MSDVEKRLILLDTHIWIWFSIGENILKKSNLLSVIEEAFHQDRARISAISLWEIGMLEAKGRIQLPMNCLDWIQNALSIPGISVIPLGPEIAIESSRLPGSFHGDPADRIIVATARHLNAQLVTQDRNIITYGKQEFLSVLSAS